MSAVNSVVLSGRLVRDPELRYGKGETPTAIFNNAIAVESYDPSAEDNRRVNFVNFVVFGNFAEKILAVKTKKGDNITIQGEIRQNTWETESGEKRSQIEVVARQVVGEFQFRPADWKNEAASGPSEDATPEADEPTENEAAPEATVDDGDDIPF